jgi:hypothetical protein
MRTTRDLSAKLAFPICEGGCGISEARHRKGVLLAGVIHYADRRLTVQTARNLLLLAARADRESDGGYLNNMDLYDFFYCYADSVAAWRMARSVGIRLPARAFDAKRAECRRLAAMRGVRLSRYRNVAHWAKS